MIMAEAKKHYASIQVLQEGNIVPEDERLDIKGIDCFVKTTMNEITREKLKGVLVEDILKAPEVDQVKILQDLAIIEKGIYNSIESGEKLYYKPARVKSINAYDNPMRIQGIKASIAYNAIKEDSMAALDLESRNSISIIKTNMNLGNINLIKDKYPIVYMRAVTLMNGKDFNGSIDAVALPDAEPVPKWILPFVDYANIINDCVSLFPLESVGIYRGNKTNNYTNIINF